MILDKKEKKYIIINICRLNDLMIPNIYSLLLQLEIIISFQDYIYLAILDIILILY